MPPTPADTFVDSVIDKEQIKSLAVMYDRFGSGNFSGSGFDILLEHPKTLEMRKE
jgi:hypothetical protein